MKKKICVLFGGKSEEYEVSLTSSYTILTSIDTTKYEIYKIGITKDGKWLRYYGSNENILNDTWQKETSEVIIDFSTGCVDNLPKDTIFFPVMHGTFCEDGRMQGIFESLNLKYVGCDSASSFLCMDKTLTKLVAESLNIPVVPSVCVNKSNFNLEVLKDEVINLTYPVFVKPTKSGSSRGSNIVKSQKELLSALKSAFEFSNTVLIEKYIKCTECEIGALSTQSITIFSHVGSLSYEGDFYGYEEKYVNKKSIYSIPARVSISVQDKITSYAKTLFSSLGCYGLSRLDFFVDGKENVYFNEINTFPGFTGESMYPMLFNEMGYSLSALIDILIENVNF